MVVLCLGLVVVAFVISAPGVRVVERVSRRLGALDTEPMEGQVKFDRRSIPNTGGIGIFLAIALPIGIGIAAVHQIGRAHV